MISKEELYDVCKNLYEKKENIITIEEIASYYNCCRKTFNKMSPENWKKDVPDYFKTVFKDLNQFQDLNEISAYWIGYLLADGCITDDRLMLECKTDDKEILQKFCDFLDIRQNRITSGHHGKSVCLSLSLSNFSNTDFNSYSLIKNKSQKELFVNSIILNNDELFYSFLKGLFDGDGTVHTCRQSIGISICGTSKQLFEDIKEKIQQTLPTPTSCWIVKRELSNRLPLYTFKIGAGVKRNNLKFLFDKFYSNEYIVLTRKYDLFRSLI